MLYFIVLTFWRNVQTVFSLLEHSSTVIFTVYLVIPVAGIWNLCWSSVSVSSSSCGFVSLYIWFCNCVPDTVFKGKGLSTWAWSDVIIFERWCSDASGRFLVGSECGVTIAWWQRSSSPGGRMTCSWAAVQVKDGWLPLSSCSEPSVLLQSSGTYQGCSLGGSWCPSFFSLVP